MRHCSVSGSQLTDDEFEEWIVKKNEWKHHVRNEKNNLISDMCVLVREIVLNRMLLRLSLDLTIVADDTTHLTSGLTTPSIASFIIFLLNL